MFTAEDKAAILVEALPYIQQFYGKTIVIKYGGNAMINDDLKEKVMQDIALMKYVGMISQGSSRRLARNRILWQGLESPMKKPLRLRKWCSTARSIPRLSIS